MQVYKLSGFKLPYKLNTVEDKAVNSPFLAINNTETQCSKEDFSKDMWNFGVTFYFLLNMEFPFGNLGLTQRADRLKFCRANNSRTGKQWNSPRRK